MDVTLSPEAQAVIQQAIDAGMFTSVDEAVEHSVSQLALYLQTPEFWADVREKVDVALANLDPDNWIEAGPEFFENIRRKGRERLAAERAHIA